MMAMRTIITTSVLNTDVYDQGYHMNDMKNVNDDGKNHDNDTDDNADSNNYDDDIDDSSNDTIPI